jgi:hypothetical protein
MKAGTKIYKYGDMGLEEWIVTMEPQSIKPNRASLFNAVDPKSGYVIGIYSSQDYGLSPTEALQNAMIKAKQKIEKYKKKAKTIRQRYLTDSQKNAENIRANKNLIKHIKQHEQYRPIITRENILDCVTILNEEDDDKTNIILVNDLRLLLKEKDFESLEKYMHGQTIIMLEKGDWAYFENDVRRWSNNQPPLD